MKFAPVASHSNARIDYLRTAMNSNTPIQATKRTVASANKTMLRRVGAFRSNSDASEFSTALRFDALRLAAFPFTTPPLDIAVVSRRVRSVLLMRSFRV
jgi:hypothetical protein